VCFKPTRGSAERSINGGYRLRVRSLQTHEGSAESRPFFGCSSGVGFKPTRGSAESRRVRTRRPTNPASNPRGVRLKVQTHGRGSDERLLQTHEGSAERFSTPTKWWPFACFKPTRVRLKGRSPETRTVRFKPTRGSAERTRRRGRKSTCFKPTRGSAERTSDVCWLQTHEGSAERRRSRRRELLGASNPRGVRLKAHVVLPWSTHDLSVCFKPTRGSAERRSFGWESNATSALQTHEGSAERANRRFGNFKPTRGSAERRCKTHDIFASNPRGFG